MPWDCCVLNWVVRPFNLALGRRCVQVTHEYLSGQQGASQPTLVESPRLPEITACTWHVCQRCLTSAAPSLTELFFSPLSLIKIWKERDSHDWKGRVPGQSGNNVPSYIAHHLSAMCPIAQWIIPPTTPSHIVQLLLQLFGGLIQKDTTQPYAEDGELALRVKVFHSAQLHLAGHATQWERKKKNPKHIIP